MKDSAAQPMTVAELLGRIDRGWAEFRSLVDAYPLERVDEPIGRGWTRKQMLAHVAAWHDRATDRLLAFAKSGKKQPAGDDVDRFNARVGRAAVGRTAGEVIHALDASFRRLRRQVGLLVDEQLAMHGGWAAKVVAGDTFDHYAEHRADLEPPGSESAAERD